MSAPDSELTAYKYDVFVSYRRAGRAQVWVEDHFVPTLTDCLAYEMPDPPRIFFDGRLEDGTTWPPDLGRSLAASRMLISLWSKQYLNSAWCSLELSHMLAREAETGFRSATNPGGLVAIAVINDGEKLPGQLGAIQKLQIREHFNTRMRKDSEAAALLEAALRAHAPTLAEIIRHAPTFKPAWATEAATRFFSLFNETAPPSQDERPSFTGS